MASNEELETVLTLWRGVALQLGYAPTGYGDIAISAHEKALAKPLPWEIRRLYSAFDPPTWEKSTGGANEPSLLPLENLKWNNSLVYSPTGIREVRDSPLEPGWLVFGAFGYGDMLVWCEEYAVEFKRAILFVYHDGRAPIVLGDSLAGWLRRLYMCNGIEYADTVDALEASALPEEVKRKFKQDHIRLNPFEP